MVSSARKKASIRWLMRNYDNICLRVPKGQRGEIKAFAAASGESMNNLVRRAISELMERENKKN